VSPHVSAPVAQAGPAVARGALRSGTRVAVASVAVNLLLAIAAIWTGWRGGSMTVLAAGVEFAADVAASCVVLVGFWYASRPPDSNHPYGHGRAETLTGLLVGLGLVLVGLAIVTHGFTQMGAGPRAAPAAFTVWPVSVALVVKSALMMTKWRVARRIGSQAMLADAWNDSVDVLSALAALVALGLAVSSPERFGAADAVGAVLVGAFVVVAGVGVVRTTSLDLIDTMPSDALIAEVRRAALRVEGVRGVEKCFGRRTGVQYHVDLHLEVDGWISVDQGHRIAARTRDAVRQQVPAVVDVLVHVEPRATDDASA
jgi:cation diffusion facilitator family transporter